MLGLICFVILFYNREPGLNVLLFCAIAWLLTGYNLEGFKDYMADPVFWWLSLAVGLTTGAYTFYGDAPSMLCVFLSFYILGVYLTDRKIHVILYPLMLAYSFGTFIVRIFFIDRWIPPRVRARAAQNTVSTPTTPASSASVNKASKESTWISIWMIPIVIALLFLIVYMSSSTMFARILVRYLPNLDFGTLFALTLLGFFLLFNFMYVLPIKWLYDINEKVIKWNREGFANQQATSAKQAAAHYKGAVIALTLLLGLLALFLCIYSYELYRGIHEQRLSAAVHEQVNSIIVSIIMAVGVILYYIRPQGPGADRQAVKQPPVLRKLAIAWILLNSLLVISAGMHNAAYIDRYGLTLLRIGVFIFLLLSITGLYFTYLKIRDQRTAGYLISNMLKIFFVTIMLNSMINWSAIVTRYNLTYMQEPDLYYLRSLNYNKHILYHYCPGNI